MFIVVLLTIFSVVTFAAGQQEATAEALKGKVTMSGGAYLMRSAQDVWDTGSMPAKYPNIKFKATGYPYLEYAKKMKIAIAANESDPDILVVHSRWIQDFLALDLVIPITDHINKDDQVAEALLEVTIDDEIYGYIYEIAPVVIYYRNDIMEEMGFDLPTTLDQYFAVGRKIAATGKYWDLIDPAGGTHVAAIEREFLNFITQLGGDVFGKDGSVILNTAKGKGVEAAQLYYRLFKADFTGHINAERPEGFTAVKEGKVAGNYIGYAWVHRMRDAIKEGDPTFGEWRMGTPPSLVPGGARSGSETGTWVFINKLSDNKKAAIEVAKYFGHSLEGQSALANKHVIIGGYKPALEYLQDHSAAWPLLGGQGVQAKIAEILLTQKVPIAHADPAMGEAQDILRDYLTRMLNEEMTPKEAMDAAASKIQKAQELK